MKIYTQTFQQKTFMVLFAKKALHGYMQFFRLFQIVQSHKVSQIHENLYIQTFQQKTFMVLFVKKEP